MKKGIFSFTAVAVILCTVLVQLSSCEKDEGKLPNIAFKTGASYTSANATVTSGSIVTIGITASKAEDKDVLNTFNITKSVNGATATNLASYPIVLTGADRDAYDHDFTITAGGAGTTEAYSFIVVNRDGLINTVSLTLTIN